MKFSATRPLAVLLCCVVLGTAPGCAPLNEDSSGLRLWVADLPNPFDRDRPRPLVRVNRWAKAGKTKKVYVEGEVLRQSPLLNGIAYEIQDSTGRIWIQTQRRDVVLGDRVHVQGQLRRHEAAIGGLDFGDVYLEELKQVEPEA